MKTIYLDCSMGAAGDMLTAALLELYGDWEGFVAEMNALGLPGVRYEAVDSEKCGVHGTHIEVYVDGQVESPGETAEHHHEHEHEHDHHHDHVHDHDHDHHHDHHHHASMADIEAIIRPLDVSEKVKADAMAVYRIIADAEAKVHGGTADTVNFHEVGAMDAVADVLAVCLLLQKLSPDAVICSTVTVGYGHVHCAHGILPVPAPATANILLGMPITAGHFEGELCTPTGAALLKHFVTDFGNLRSFKAEKIGYGMGTKNFPAANCVRALLGETAAENDSISVLSCNLDDMTPEAVGFAMELLLENGALDAFSVPVTMKKSRPAVVLTCLCKPDEESKFTALMLKHTSTLGVRKTAARRTVLEREFKTVETPYGTVRIKLSHHPEKSKPEYDDVAKIARDHGLSFDEARKIAEKHL